jgi:SAM-dependent methyltransferase
MIQTREHFYQPGLPAKPGEQYNAFLRFARRHVGMSILDFGCGFGAYSGALMAEGRNCVGCDINVEYLRRAVADGIPAAAVDSRLPFQDKSFDSVLLFEVLEHVAKVENLLDEAFRVARRNVLITVPNCEDVELMKYNDVTYAHMLSSDHVNFFDPASLKHLLQIFSDDVWVERADPILPFWFVGRSLPFYILRSIYRAGILKPRFFTRLYAVASVR